MLDPATIVGIVMRIGLGVLDRFNKGEISDEEFHAYLARGETHSDEFVDSMVEDGIDKLRGS